MHIVIFGNPMDGFSYVGPFASHEIALQYAEGEGHDWWITELSEPPEEFRMLMMEDL